MKAFMTWVGALDVLVVGAAWAWGKTHPAAQPFTDVIVELGSVVGTVAGVTGLRLPPKDATQ